MNADTLLRAGVYRVNRRRSHLVGDGQFGFTSVDSRYQVIPAELGELPALRGFAVVKP